MQDMFTSTRPVSVLYLKGAEGDDPDLFPVSLPSDALSLDTSREGLRRHSSWDRKPGDNESDSGSSFDSPLVSARTAGPSTRKASAFHPARHATGDWPLSASVPNSDYASGFCINGPTRVQRRSRDADNGPEDWIEAVGVDPSYVPPPEHGDKPVACIYVRPRSPPSHEAAETFYHAVYLRNRSRDDLVRGIARKFKVDQRRVGHVFRIMESGLRVLVDDEFVEEMSEGQDMVVEWEDTDQGDIKIEPLAGLDDLPLEMRLFF